MAWRSLAKEKERGVLLSEEIEELCNGIGQLCVDMLRSSTEVYCGAMAMQRGTKQSKGRVTQSRAELRRVANSKGFARPGPAQNSKGDAKK